MTARPVMHAAVYRETGDSSVLTVEDIEVPEPGPGEVRVRLRIAGVNPTDWKRRSTAAPDGFQIPGQDGAGEIDAVGAGVDPGRVGERVWVWFCAAPGRRFGSAAQFTVVPARQAVRLPDEVSLDAGAGFGIPAMTAWHCLYGGGGADGRGGIAGRTVLVAGGAGAVGNVAVALARRGGAYVITTVSGADKAATARAAGAHHVVNYRDADAAEQVRSLAPEGVDHIVELALGANLDLDLAVLAPRSSIALYADDPLADLPIRRFMTGNVDLRFVMIYGRSDTELTAAAAGVGAAAPDLPTLPVRRFPLAEISRAHDAVQQGFAGKVLLDLP